MGTRTLTSAFMRLVAADPTVRRRVRELILVAPDIDSAIFKNDIAPVLVGTGSARTQLTLYASSNDKALAASRMVHGAPRAGDLGQGLVLMNGIETIDASEVDASFLNHSPYDDNRSVVSDISVLIKTGERACNRFRLEAIKSAAGVLCLMRP
jgi:esterase/lipase superfamily enzyme